MIISPSNVPIGAEARFGCGCVVRRLDGPSQEVRSALKNTIDGDGDGSPDDVWFGILLKCSYGFPYTSSESSSYCFFTEAERAIACGFHRDLWASYDSEHVHFDPLAAALSGTFT